MNAPSFDYKEARKYCMNFGMRVAFLWSISFLCSMYGSKYPLLSILGFFFGLYSIFFAGRLIRWYNQQAPSPARFLRSWWMALLTYFFATLATTLVQYIYFRFLDHGMLLSQVELIMNTPEYSQLLQGINEEEFKQSMTIMSNPSQMTYSMFLMNMTLGLILSLPTSLIGYIGLNNK